jgi:hypothetical protein
MKAVITIDGINYTPEQTMSLASAVSPFRGGYRTVGDAVAMLRMMGQEVVTEPECVVGIDNGLNGAIVVLAASNGDVLARTEMPVRKREKNEVDVIALRDWLKENIGEMGLHDFVLEKPVGSKSVNAAKSMHGSYHAVRATIEVMGGNFYDIAAKTWQKAMLPKGDTKELSIAVSQRRWPDEDWRKNERCRTPHADACDAANIAEYWRKQPDSNP